MNPCKFSAEKNGHGDAEIEVTHHFYRKKKNGSGNARIGCVVLEADYTKGAATQQLDSYDYIYIAK